MPDELAEIIDGLQQEEKAISPKYFYDETGSQLFEEITQLPEYYLTDVELGIMDRYIDEMAALIGADLQKDPAVIEAAYNDSAGVTARFNLNMLEHLNREFDMQFDVDAFEHRATYDAEEGRIVMELVSTREQVVGADGTRIPIARDEAIRTEYSHKYTIEDFAEIIAAGGFTTQKVWTDPDRWFSVHFCTRD